MRWSWPTVCVALLSRHQQHAVLPAVWCFCMRSLCSLMPPLCSCFGFLEGVCTQAADAILEPVGFILTIGACICYCSASAFFCCLCSLFSLLSPDCVLCGQFLSDHLLVVKTVGDCEAVCLCVCCFGLAHCFPMAAGLALGNRSAFCLCLPGACFHHRSDVAKASA